jgi:hypothetical protein
MPGLQQIQLRGGGKLGFACSNLRIGYNTSCRRPHRELTFTQLFVPCCPARREIVFACGMKSAAMALCEG